MSVRSSQGSNLKPKYWIIIYNLYKLLSSLEHCDHIQVVNNCTMSKFPKPILPTMCENPPPIPFVTKLKKLEAEGADSDKHKVDSIRFWFLVYPEKSASR